MNNRRGRITVVCTLILFTGLLSLVIAFGGTLNHARAGENDPHDACGRPLFAPDGQPLQYQEPCEAANGLSSPGEAALASPDRFEAPYLAFSTGGSQVEAVSLDDFDQDGKLDMALSTSYYFDPARDQRIWVARQNNPAGFTLVYSATVGASDPESLEVADMDGDGYLDIIVANAHTGAGGIGDVEIFWGIGYFTFTRTEHLAGNTPYAVAVMPVYTHTLAVVTNWNDTVLSTYLGGAGHTLVQTNYPASQAGWNQLAVGDLNADSDPDIAAMWGQTYAVPAFTAYFGDGQGSLTPGPSFPKNNQNPSAIAVGDVTNDGRDDVVITRGGNVAEILIYAQQPTGILTLSAAYPSLDVPESLDIADVNCDGFNDVIATNSGWYAFSWWPGTKEGALGAYQVESHTFYFSHIGPNGAEMADINGDGLKDYVVVDYNSDGILVALQRSCRKLYLPFLVHQPTRR